MYTIIVQFLGLDIRPTNSTVSMDSDFFLKTIRKCNFGNLKKYFIHLLWLVYVLLWSLDRTFRTYTKSRNSIFGQLTTNKIVDWLAYKFNLFLYLKTNRLTVSWKFRGFSREEKVLIRKEIRKPLDSHISEICRSPWKALVVITKDRKWNKKISLNIWKYQNIRIL